MASLVVSIGPLVRLLGAVGAISSLVLLGLMNLIPNPSGNTALSQFPIDALLEQICSAVRPGKRFCSRHRLGLAKPHASPWR